MGGVDLNIMLDNLFQGTQQAMVSSIVGLGIFLINRFIIVFTNWSIFNDEKEDKSNKKELNPQVLKVVEAIFSEINRKEEPEDEL